MRIRVTGRDGSVESLECEPGTLLMRALAERDLVDATCGGECSCATCQVYVEEGALRSLPAPGESERELLAGLTHSRPSSRLSCQIVLTEVHDGMHVEIAQPD